VLIISAEGRWADRLDCEMKGLDSMVGTAGCEGIESEIRLVGQLQGRGWECRSRGQGVRY